MKKCPQCGVLVGNNAIRCFLCKYNFWQEKEKDKKQ